MSVLLVSLYDGRGVGRPALVTVDTASGLVERVRVDAPTELDRYMGLCVGGGLVHLIVSSDESSYLLLLDAVTLGQVGCLELPGVRDGHSVARKDDDLFVVSSGTDEVIRCELADGCLKSHEVIWAASDAGRDTSHVNGLALHSGRLLVSAFGVAPEGRLAAARNGYIHDVITDRVVSSGLAHPHSVSVRGGRVYHCESKTGRFRCGTRTLARLDGYLRGAAWVSDEVICLGSSEGRPPSGASHSSSDSCAIWFFDIRSGSPTGRVPLAEFGPEIYDIVLLAK
jgi:Domain of unknown function (DUF4915)